MKIVAVCGFGVGSSLLLKMQIDKAFRELGIDEEAMNADITTAKSTPCDAIFTSVDLEDEMRAAVKVPVYAIRHYMNAAEVKAAVEDFISKYKK